MFEDDNKDYDEDIIIKNNKKKRNGIWYRICGRCEKKFQKTSKGHRICDDCRKESYRLRKKFTGKKNKDE